VVRGGARVVARPGVLGAVYLLALTAAAAPGPLVDDAERALGRDASKIQALVQVRFAHTVLALAASIALTALVLGAALGVLAGAVLRTRRWALQRPPLRPVVFVPAAFALTLVLHVALTLHTMAWTPQLYADAFYERGGLGAAVQVFVTDTVGARRASWLGVALVALLLPPPWSWPFVARRAAESLRRAPRWALGGAVLVVFALGLLVFERPGPVAPRSPGSPPSILILGADSFREEGLSPRVMPHLAALAAERGVRFSNAHVAMARTLSSWTTLLTGRDAHHHGIRSMFPRWEEHDHDLDTLPGRLGRAGYRTAVVSDYGGDAFSTVDLGFQRALVPHLDAPEIIRSKGLARAWPLASFLDSSAGRWIFPAMRERRDCADASRLADEAIGVLRDLREGPFLLTVFFSAPHAPYAAPAPYYGRFTQRAYAQRNKYDKSLWITPDETASPERVAHVRELYEGALASVDDGAARVLGELDRLGLRDRTIVVVLGDHGENLADAPGRFYGHGNHLFGDHDLHIPFVVADPRRAGARVEPGPVTNADLAPTLYALAGVAPPADMDGVSLVPALDGAPLPPRPTFAETELWVGIQPDVPDALRFPFPQFVEYSEVDAAHHDMLVLRPELAQRSLVARHRMVRDGSWKLLYIPTAAGALYQLFDVVTDPENLTDVAAAHPEETARLKGLLWDWMLRDPGMERRHGFLAPKGVTFPEIDGVP
jgi:arylsulfatase A-like enzyme